MMTPIETSVYQRAELEIDILFPMVTTRLTQVFSNPSEEVIEAIYQFPVPTESVLGDIAVSINHERYTGVIKKKESALFDYEETISDGKRAVLLNDLGDGLMELNAGNLASGDELSVTLTIHALLDTMSDHIRYHMPTCIAPKYGASPLDETSTPTHNALARYPFTAHVKMHKQSSLRIIDCTHELEDSGQGMRFKGTLNQDISLQLQRLEQAPCALSVEENGMAYSVACFDALPIKTANRPANLQLVVDCSGSMGGRSIGQVRKGLSRAFEAISHHDQINLIRFGCSVHPAFEGLRRFEGKHRDIIEEITLGMDADLGGTEMVDALEVALQQLEREEQSSIVLLTDGQVWEDDPKRVDNLLAQAQKQGIRIFCIGVGDNIDDAFLQKIADQTNGRLYRANPHEDLARVIAQVISQAKQKGTKADVQFDGYTLWSSPITEVLEGELPVILACNRTTPERICLNREGSEECSITPEPITQDAISFERALKQLCVHRRIRDEQEDLAEQLAEEAQIISRYTSFILTTDEQVMGADGFPQPVQVPQSQSIDYLSIPAFRRANSRSVDTMASHDSLQEYNRGPRFLIGDSEEESWIDFSLIERYLNRRVFKVQSIDFDFIKLCGASDFIAKQLEELYIYALQEGDEVFTIDNFVARFILFHAELHEYSFKPRVKARLESHLWESELPIEEYFEHLDDWQETCPI